MGGVVAFAVWGLVVAGYMASRQMGVGPGASLVSAGVLDAQSEVLIAEFENKTGDELLGEALKEALSIDLSQSTAIKVVSPDRVVKVLMWFQRSDGRPRCATPPESVIGLSVEALFGV